jgi:hypothetical protein
MPTDLHALAPTELVTDHLRYALVPDTRRRVVLSVRLEPESADGGPLPFRDRVDLVSHRARLRLAGTLADLFGRERRELLVHLTLLLDQAERAAAAPPPNPHELSPERRAAAQALLERPTLLDDLAQALTSLGLTGEEETKRLAYLTATSRLLPRPLSAILLAPSGCGKSSLLDAIEALLPPEDVLFLSRLTGQALFYAGPDALCHKLVVIDEQAGASDADYSLRTLQSKGSLTLRTGRGEVTVKGPISLMSGTTSTDLNPENLSRCLELTLDDSPSQTRRIQARQQALWAQPPRALLDLTSWQDAQRLLEPLAVRIPFAERLTFPARTTHDRRGSERLLGLIAAHALLFQRQRPRDARGALLAQPQDYAAIHALLRGGVGDVPGLSQRALAAAETLRARGPLSRRQLADALGGSYNTAKRALAELCQQELATATDPGPPVRYRLLLSEAKHPLGAGSALLDPSLL